MKRRSKYLTFMIMILPRIKKVLTTQMSSMEIYIKCEVDVENILLPFFINQRIFKKYLLHFKNIKPQQFRTLSDGWWIMSSNMRIKQELWRSNISKMSKSHLMSHTTLYASFIYFLFSTRDVHTWKDNWPQYTERARWWEWSRIPFFYYNWR